MKKILLISLVSILSSCTGWSEKHLKIRDKIVEHCADNMKIVKNEHDYEKLITCENLELKLLRDKSQKIKLGCSTSYHYCEEVRYNFELTYKGKKYPERIPQGLVMNALKELRVEKKTKDFFN